MRKVCKAPLQSQKGVVLLEALISILIFSLALIALVGLQAVMIKNASEAKFRGDASYIAQQRLGAMWAVDPATLGTFVESNTDISALLPGGTRTVALVSGTTYQITVSWQQPGESRHNLTTVTVISGT